MNIKLMIKKSPIKKPFFFDTPQGVDHVTKTVAEDSIEKMTPFKKDMLDKLNREMKLSLLKSEEQTLKKFMNEDPSTYPSDPEQRGKLMNIQALEKSLGIRPDSWRRFVKTGALPLAEKKPDLWKDVIYKGMTIQEKGQWNAEQRKEKLKKQKEFEEEKKQKRIANHTKQQWGIPDKKLADLPIIKNNINYQKIPNQDLKNHMKKWISEADSDRKKKVASSPNKPTEANGHDPYPNVIPIGPIPHEKPWYEDMKKLRAESKEAEDKFKMVLVEGALDKLKDTGIETILIPESTAVSSEPLNLDQILNISRNISRIPPKERSLVKARLIASIPKARI
tara:strand:- start:2135 stop:3142 length:1008 start_codon:yes stop_codon:yes gene_type:complete